MKVIIAGDRRLSDYPFLKRKCDRLLSSTKKQEIQIIHGAARGADKLGELYAKCREYPFTAYPAGWENHGKSAGYRRNAEMAKHATHLIAFWDGHSKGTKNMIEVAKNKNLQVRVVTIGPEQKRDRTQSFIAKRGSIFDVASDVYINPVDCKGVMRAGLAKQMASRFPLMLEGYKQACQNELSLGKLHVYKTGLPSPQYIINFPTKIRWTDNSKLCWIESGLLTLKEALIQLPIKTISIPKLGCGLGGLSWFDVKLLTTSTLGDIPDKSVYLFE